MDTRVHYRTAFLATLFRFNWNQSRQERIDCTRGGKMLASSRTFPTN